MSGGSPFAIDAWIEAWMARKAVVDQGAHLLAGWRAHQRRRGRLGRLCSNDPVCAYHRPEDEASRDTSVVVRELFRRARGSILVSSFAIDTGGKAESLFGELATRMDAEPSLNVRMFLNIHRGDSQATEAELVRGFARTFRERIWPGERKPSVFYDPRALAPAGGPRACLHAKCVVVDDAYAFVTSANFTEAAHGRNIEAGVLIEDPAFAKGLRSQFDALVEAGGVVALPR